MVDEAGPSNSLSTLHLHPNISRSTGPLLVCVLDGWGESTHEDDYNAIHVANTPNMDALKETASQHRWRLLKAHGTAVGLPTDADMGNSEVGHNALGTGQIVDQGAKCVDSALATGSLFTQEGWQYIEPAAKSGTLHLLGLLSDGGVHSRYDQLMMLMQGAVARGVRRIRLHVLSDGRDVEDGASVQWLTKLTADIDALCTDTTTTTTADTTTDLDIKIASGGGRMCTTMDRYESDWKIVQNGYYAAVLGEAQHTFADAIAGVRALQLNTTTTTASGEKNGFVSDQWLPAWVVIDPGSGDPVGPVCDGDAVVAFNFRADRMIEISQALEYPPDKWLHGHGSGGGGGGGSSHQQGGGRFDRKRYPKIKFAGMMQYDGELQLPCHFLVPPPLIEHPSELYLMNSTPKTRVFACSESQKIGHVTFFWNGNRSGYIDATHERFVEIPSDQGIAFDAAPAMKAHEIADVTVDAILSGKYDFIRCNFPNADMVGHTGNLEAAITACTVVDMCVGRLIEAVNSVGGRFLITADHGNAEEMVQRDAKTGVPRRNDVTGEVVPLTSHTLNPVPVAIGGSGLPAGVCFKSDEMLMSSGTSGGGGGAGLANVTATFLNLLGFEAPAFYEPSLIEMK